MRAHPMRIVPVALLSLCLSLGCGSQQEPHPEDAGSTLDGGSKSPDSGTEPKDAGSEPRDAGTEPDDAGTSPEDAGTEPDDAGTSPEDAGTDPDDENYPPCGVPYLGDRNGKPDFTPTALGPGMTSAPIQAGSIVSIIEPFQGGRVSFIGVRDVLNMDPCGTTLLGGFRDPITNKVVLDQRTVTLERRPDGRGASTDSDTASFSNVTLCPNNWAGADIFDQTYELMLVLTDRRGRSVYKSFNIRPACNVPGEDVICRCMCKKGYKLGEPCL